MKNKFEQLYSDHSVNKEKIYDNVIESVVKKPKKIVLKPILAACLCLFLLLGGFSGYSFYVEAQEYNEAIEFFDEYNLSKDGLSRNDIKMVYKDIKTGEFSYEKTIELFNTISVEMQQIEFNSASKEDLEALWNYRNNKINNSNNVNSEGVQYTFSYSNDKKTIIKKLDNGIEEWTYTAEHSLLKNHTNYIETNDGVIFYGEALEVYKSIIFMIDNSGNLVWEKINLDIDGNSSYGKALLEDNKITVFGTRYDDVYSKERKIYLCFAKYDTEGNEITYSESCLDNNVKVKQVIRVNDSYLVKLWSNTGNANYLLNSRLICVDLNGKPIKEYTFNIDGEDYVPQDINYYNDKVYISAIIPNIPKSEFENKFNDLITPFELTAENKKTLRELFIQQYSSALLICDENAVVKKAFSIENVKCGKLSVSDGKLLWQVIRSDDIKLAPLGFSSYRVEIIATEFSFSFNESGDLIKKTEIGLYPMKY